MKCGSAALIFVVHDKSGYDRGRQGEADNPGHKNLNPVHGAAAGEETPLGAQSNLLGGGERLITI
jgi:hypothetical protein